MKTLLITSAGSQVGEGLLACLEARRAGLRVVASNSLAEAPALYACDRAYLCPPIAEREAHARRLAEIVATERPDLIIPGRDDDIVLLAELAEAQAWPVLCGPTALTGALRDKALSAAFAAKHGLPFAETLSCGDGDFLARAEDLARRRGWPLLLKPARGNGSQDIRLLCSATQLASWAGRADYLAQPYLGRREGLMAWLDGFAAGIPLHSSAPAVEQYVAQVLLGPRGECLDVFGMRTDMQSGRSWRVERHADAALLALGRDYGQALGAAGWRGPLNVQCMAEGENYLPFEINGRFNGTSSARLRLGFDELRLTLQAFLDLDIGEPPHQPMRRVLRRSQDQVLACAAVETLNREGCWTRKD